MTRRNEQNAAAYADSTRGGRVSATTGSAGALRLVKPDADVQGVSPERLKRVAAACKAWISKLIDPSRPNNLLFFRHLTLGTPDLTSASDETIAAPLGPSQEAVALDRFVSLSEFQTSRHVYRESS